LGEIEESKGGGGREDGDEEGERDEREMRRDAKGFESRRS